MKQQQTVGVQLDLARQKESIDFVFSFIDFISANGYNTLYLHLESGIRVPSFSFAKEEKSYSPEEIRSIVNYAAQKKINTIPILATLGHAEHFLAHKQLEHLSEQRGNGPGREFCPSLEETYDFLFSFLKEVSALFDSNEIHVGCDEVFHLASCPLCKERVEQGESRGEIFRKHLLRIHAFVTQILGKKMMIWDDMMDFVPEILSQLPKDVECVFWEYDPLVSCKQTKFGNRKRIDIFREYDKLGLAYHAAPRELSLDNVTTFFHYAEKYHPKGLLLTVWEHSCDFMYAFYPLIGFAGRLWNDKSANQDRIFAEVCRDLLGDVSDTLILAIQGAFHQEDPLNTLTQSISSHGYKRYPNPQTGAALSRLQLIAEIFRKEMDSVTTPLGHLILQDLLTGIEIRIADWKTALWQTRRLENNNVEQPESLISMWKGLLDARSSQWDRIRPGLPHGELDHYFNQRMNLVRNVEADAQKMRSKLQIRFFLADYWGRQSVELFIRKTNGSAFESVYKGMPKPNESGEHPFYTYEIPLSCDSVSEVRISSSGWNGIGVCFCCIVDKNGEIHHPRAVHGADGMVSEPTNLLENDTTWTMFGNRDGMRLIFDQEAGAVSHSVILTFQNE